MKKNVSAENAGPRIRVARFSPDPAVGLSHEQVEQRAAEGCKNTPVDPRSELGVKLTFNRTMAFEPEGLFRLSVTYGVMLTFDPSTKNEVDWDGLDIAGEFRKSCGGTLTALMSRTSLMIGQITAAAGQNPIITPAAAPIDSTGAVSNS